MARTHTTTELLSSQPVAKQRKRRTTSSGIDTSKPRREPPPPPTQAVATPPAPPTLAALPEVGTGQSSADMGGVSETSLTERQVAPPPRRGPKVKRIKRPTSRLIPPPPNIPLPPPPAKTARVAPPQSSEKHELTDEELQGTSNEEVVRNSGKLTEAEAVVSQERRAESKPPVKPKPAHLEKSMKQLQSSQAIATPSRSLTLTPTAKGSPKPAPPARSSSLSTKSTPPLRVSGTLPPITDTSENTDSVEERNAGENTDSVEERDAAERTANTRPRLHSPPPHYPPPSRPALREQGEPVLKQALSRHRSNPPSFPPPQRPDLDNATSRARADGERMSPAASAAVSRTNSLKARGTQLMRSLKKMVSRSDSKDESHEVGSGIKPHPPQPPKRSIQEGEVIENLSTESPAAKEPPVVKRRVSETQTGLPTATRPLVATHTQPSGQETETIASSVSQTVLATSTTMNGSPHKPKTEAAASLDASKDHNTSGIPAHPPPPRVARKRSGSSERETRSVSPSSTTVYGSPHKPLPGKEAAAASSHPPQSTDLPESQTPSRSPPALSERSTPSASRSSSPQSPPTSFYRAKEDYSGKTPSELTLHKGDVLIEIDRPTAEMHYGMLDDGTTGLFPASAVEPLLSPSRE